MVTSIILANIYKQTVRPVTLWTTSIGVLYGYCIENKKSHNNSTIANISKYGCLGAVCGVAYPVSISYYTLNIVRECIRNPYTPSTDAPIL